MSAKKRSGTAREKPGVNGGVKSPSRSSDHARAREAARALRDTRVTHIADLMTKFQWHGLRTHRKLAAKWECSVGAVADYAREASGIIRRAVSGDLDVIRTEILTGIHRVRDVALKLTKPMLVAKDTYDFVNTPDVNAALRSYELQAKMLGLFPAEPSVERAPDTMTPEEHRAELAKLKAEIVAEEKRLAEEGQGGTLQ
jgi:hypothetical protein